ncbi:MULTISPECIES: cysteine-rich CWC family protein [Pseudomonas]|uniref:cysteine-rich CWC family protein n=1 Tax=Pseudomonas TaxID=286 RepID=UPI000C905922|nr:hypothetical protein [Pseudomonadales bacterium]
MQLAPAGSDAARCPFCAGANACAAESGSCWCFNLSVPEALLALVPTEQRHRACICQHCVRAFTSDPNGFAGRYRLR